LRFIIVSMLVIAAAVAGGIQVPVGFSAQFTQKITSPKKKVIKYSGTLLLNSSGALKWSYKKPTRKEVCSDAKHFTIVDHDLEQVSFHELRQALSLTSILKKARHHKDNLYVATYQNVLYTFALDKKGQISQIAYKDTLDNVVNIHFQHMRYRSKPNLKRTMQCPYPQSYDIIRG